VGIKVVDEIERRTAKDVEPPAPAPARPASTITAQAAEARKSARPSAPPPVESVNAALGQHLGGPTPGPEALASVLEPSLVQVGRPPQRKAGRSFFIGAAIGVVLLGAAVAALVVRKNTVAPTPAAHSSAQP
jgi:hypothetical protein